MIDFHSQLAIIPKVYETAQLQDNLEHSNGISLSWKSATDEEIPLGSFITYKSMRYILLEPYAPSKQGIYYNYGPLFKHPQNMLDLIPFWIKSLDAQGNPINLSTTSYTGFPHVIAEKLVTFMAEYANETGDAFFADTVDLEQRNGVWMPTWTYNIPLPSPGVDTNAIITVGFDGCSIKSAADAIANAMGCNVYWDWSQRRIMFIAGTTIQGETYNCFHVLGGTTNMAKITTSGSFAAVTQRMTLKTPTEIIEEGGSTTFTINGKTCEIVNGSIIKYDVSQGGIMLTKDLTLDDIFPKMELYIKSARKRLCYLTDDEGDYIVDHYDGSTPVYKTFAKWYVTFSLDAAGTVPYVFSKTYIINDLPLGLLFQIDYQNTEYMSTLVGRQFDLTYYDVATQEHDKTDVNGAFNIQAGEFYISVIGEGDRILPTDESQGMYPEVGKKVTLLNINLSDEKKRAQDDLLEASKEIISLMNTPSGEYTENVIFADEVEGQQPRHTIPFVQVGDASPFDTTKHGPVVTGISLNIDTNVADVTVGSWSRKTKTGGMGDKIEAVTVSAASATNGNDNYSSGNLGESHYEGQSSKSVSTIYQTQLKPSAPFVASLSSVFEAVSCNAKGIVMANSNIYTKVSANYGTKDITSVCSVSFTKTLPNGVKIYIESSGSGTSGTEMSPNNAYAMTDGKAWLRFSIGIGTELGNLNIPFTINHPAYGDKVVGFSIGCIKAGSDISKVSESSYYAVSQSGTVQPTLDGDESAAAILDRWYGTREKVASLWVSNYWLWVKTVIGWSDGNNTVLYTNERNPNDGREGMDIVSGVTTITYCVKQYQQGVAPTQPQDSEFAEYSQIASQITPGKWLWSKATTPYYKGSTSGEPAGSSSNYNVSYIGTNGADGTTKTGQSVVYQVGNSGTVAPTGTWYDTMAAAEQAQPWSPDKYMWSRTSISWSDGTTTTIYSAERNPNDGEDGMSVSISSQSVQYAKTNSSTRPSDSEFGDYPSTLSKGDWLHSRTTVSYSNGDSTVSYAVSYIGTDGAPGSAGRGISNVTEYYAVSDSSTVAPQDDSFTTTVPATWNITNKYLWNYESISYTSGEPTSTTKKVIAIFTKNGRGIDSIVNYYLATNQSSGVTKDTHGWTISVQSVTPSQRYLWNYEVITYVDGSPSTTESSPHIIGVYGESVTAQYAATSTPTQAQIHNMFQDGDKYMRTISSADADWSNWQRIVGEDGTDGTDGQNGDYTDFSFAISAALTTSNAETAPSDITSWYDAPIQVTAQKPYLWCKQVSHTFNGGTETIGTAKYFRMTGEVGAAGRAINSITEYYKASTLDGSTGHQETAPSDDSGWDTDPNLSHLSNKWGATYKYLWNYEKIEYSSGTRYERTIPQILAIFTQDGTDGADGKGIDSITNLYCVTSAITPVPTRRHELPSGATDPWDDNPTAPSPGEYLWNYEIISWTDGSTTYTAVQMIGHSGTNGEHGGNTATLFLYKRSVIQPTVKPQRKLWYKFSTKKLYTNEACTIEVTDNTANMYGWKTVIPNGTDPLWVTSAIAYSQTDVDNIDYTPNNEWVTPAKLSENGQDGQDGQDGLNGINTASVFLYQRAATQPTTKPQSNVYYKFADGKLYTKNGNTYTEVTYPLDGWYLDFPTSDGNPCWVIQAAALSNQEYDEIATSDWSGVKKMVEDGADAEGINQSIQTYLEKIAVGASNHMDDTTYVRSSDNSIVIYYKTGTTRPSGMLNGDLWFNGNGLSAYKNNLIYSNNSVDKEALKGYFGAIGATGDGTGTSKLTVYRNSMPTTGLQQYDIFVNKSTFTDTFTGRTIDGAIGVWIYYGDKWEYVVDNTYAAVENFGKAIVSAVFGTQSIPGGAANYASALTLTAQMAALYTSASIDGQQAIAALKLIIQTNNGHPTGEIVITADKVDFDAANVNVKGSFQTSDGLIQLTNFGTGSNTYTALEINDGDVNHPYVQLYNGRSGGRYMPTLVLDRWNGNNGEVTTITCDYVESPQFSVRSGNTVLDGVDGGFMVGSTYVEVNKGIITRIG